jgi:hypothetical protein
MKESDISMSPWGADRTYNKQAYRIDWEKSWRSKVAVSCGTFPFGRVALAWPAHSFLVRRKERDGTGLSCPITRSSRSFANP